MLAKDEHKIEWIDQWDCTNHTTVAGAREILKNYLNEWPGGLDQIESSITYWRNRSFRFQTAINDLVEQGVLSDDDLDVHKLSGYNLS